MKKDFINRYPFAKKNIIHSKWIRPEEYEDLEPLREFGEDCLSLLAGTFYGPVHLFQYLRHFLVFKESPELLENFVFNSLV
jgi:hypothetical protein